MPATEHDLERALYVGDALGAILLGVQLTLCFQSLYFLSKGPSSAYKRNIFYMIYSLVLAVIVAISLAANFIFGQFIWINHRDVPGGPAAFFAENVTAWYNTFGTSAGAASVFMGDALLLYRCYIITGSLWMCIGPAIVFLASTSMGIVSVISSAKEFLLKGRPAQYGTSWTSLSVGFNIIVTTIIVLKLLHSYRRLRYTTSSEYAAVYTSVTAIFIEAALPYALFGIIFSVLYGRNNVSSLAFAVVWIGLTGITPQLIILRIAMGTAWSKDTTVNASDTTGMTLKHSEILKNEKESHTMLNTTTVLSSYSV